MKCDPTGNAVWKKTFPDCIPMDMVRRSDGSLVLAVRDVPGYQQIVVLYLLLPDGNVETHPIVHFPFGGSASVVNVNMHAMDDNSIVMSGVYLQSLLVGLPLRQEGFMLQLSSTFVKLWNYVLFQYNVLDQSYPLYEQNSIIPVPGNRFLAQFSFTGDKVQADGVSYGLLTMVVNPDTAVLDYYSITSTGFEVQSSGLKGGYFNHYADGLIGESGGQAVFHYSGPVSVATGLPHQGDIPNGFIRVAADASILDTIPLPLPEGYRILSCSFRNGNFMVTACKSGTVDVTSDFRAYQTLFLTGNSGWETTRSFTLQEFYSDFLSSSAPTSDGGFVLMGKIQSFNGPNNQLILIKWKNQ
jgi:hypothetical protein